MHTEVASLRWKELIFLLDDMRDFAKMLSNNGINPVIVNIHFDGEYWIGVFNWEIEQ